jgi:three-Cys-motif partner protein
VAPRKRKISDDQLSMVGPVSMPPGLYVAHDEDLRGLIEMEDGLYARVIAPHSIDKAYYARRYADIVASGMKRKWAGHRWWIELFAGPGQLYVKAEDRVVHGSPLEAIAIDEPFDGYVFSDLDPRCVESLRARVGANPNVHVLEGDANSLELLDQLAALVPRDELVVLYADQEGLDLGWETVRFLLDRYRHLDLLLNLPVAGAVRALAAGHEDKASKMLGHPNPLELLGSGRGRGVPLRDFYRRQLRARSYRHIDWVTIRTEARNVELYDLMLASRHPRALDFFRKITGIRADGQRPLFQAG